MNPDNKKNKKSRILEAVGQSSDENIQQVFLASFSNTVSFGKLLSSQDNFKKTKKDRKLCEIYERFPS